MYSQKYIFHIALKCERKTRKKKEKKSGRARFSGTGGDDHQFCLCGLIFNLGSIGQSEWFFGTMDEGVVLHCFVVKNTYQTMS
jgi:hypothetical protein